MKKIFLAIFIIFSAINISARDIDTFYNYNSKNSSRSYFISYTENTEKVDIIPIYRNYKTEDFSTYLNKYELKLRYKTPKLNYIISGAYLPKREDYKGSFYRLGLEKNTQFKDTPLTIWAFLVYRRHENYVDAEDVVLATPYKNNQLDIQAEFKFNLSGNLLDFRYLQNLTYSNGIDNNTRDPLWIEHTAGRDAGFLNRAFTARFLTKRIKKFKFRGTFSHITYKGQRKYQNDLELGFFYVLTTDITLYYMGKIKSIDGKVIDGGNGYRSKFGLRWFF